MCKRFIKYVVARAASWQTALFDTVTFRSTYASDFMFKPDELKRW